MKLIVAIAIAALSLGRYAVPILSGASGSAPLTVKNFPAC